MAIGWMMKVSMRDSKARAELYKKEYTLVLMWVTTWDGDHISATLNTKGRELQSWNVGQDIEIKAKHIARAILKADTHIQSSIEDMDSEYRGSRGC